MPVHKDAQWPAKGSADSAGYDLTSVEDAFIPPGKRAAINIGIKTQIPKGYYGRIADRSGLAFRNGLTVLAGVIDSDYRGEWKVILLNTGDQTVRISVGDRIAQVVITPCAHFPLHIVMELDETDRGEGGFGSTGI